MEGFMEDVFPLCEMIMEECRRERRKEEIVRMFSFVPEQVINTILEFLCQTEFLKKEGEKYKLTKTGKAFLDLPMPEGGDEFDAN